MREAAAILSTPKSTVHKRLRHLVEKGLATLDNGGFRATMKGIISA